MSRIVWGEPGSRRYEHGCDRGVLYLPDSSGVPWNGLVSVVEDFGSGAVTPHYYDGVKYTNSRSVDDFAATLSAITYPDEFEQFEGRVVTDEGIILTDQPVKDYFGLSYRTLVGNDTEGNDHGYQIHVLYNLSAAPSNKNYQSLSDSVDLNPFEWAISGIPIKVPGFKPTVHFRFDTRKLNKYLIWEIEELLYGSDTQEPQLPTIFEILDLIRNWEPLIVIDNGDGTLTITGTDDDVKALTETFYEVESETIQFIAPDTYQISSQE